MMHPWLVRAEKFDLRLKKAQQAPQQKPLWEQLDEAAEGLVQAYEGLPNTPIFTRESPEGFFNQYFGGVTPGSVSPWELQTPTMRAMSFRKENLPYTAGYLGLNLAAAKSPYAFPASIAAEYGAAPLANMLYADAVGQRIEREQNQRRAALYVSDNKLRMAEKTKEQLGAALGKYITDATSTYTNRPEGTQSELVVPLLAGALGAGGAGLLTGNILSGAASGLGLAILMWLLRSGKLKEALNESQPGVKKAQGGWLSSIAKHLGLLLANLVTFGIAEQAAEPYLHGGMGRVRRMSIEHTATDQAYRDAAAYNLGLRYNTIGDIHQGLVFKKFFDILQKTNPDLHKSMLSQIYNEYIKSQPTSTQIGSGGPATGTQAAKSPSTTTGSGIGAGTRKPK